jgi:hypothetical protein
LWRDRGAAIADVEGSVSELVMLFVVKLRRGVLQVGLKGDTNFTIMDL